VKGQYEGLGCGREDEPKKNEIIAEPEELYFTHMGRKNSWSDLDEILQ